MKHLFLALLFALSGSQVLAADAVEATLQAFKVIASAKGAELQATKEAKPGDTIEYQIAYRNTGKAAARNVVATLPVPAGGMTYLAGSASPAAAEASLDGKQFSPLPLTRTVLRDGRQVTETVPPAEYRALRWNLGELAAGQTITVKSRMRLDSSNTATTRQ